MLTKGGGGVQEPLILADVICEQPLKSVSNHLQHISCCLDGKQRVGTYKFVVLPLPCFSALCLVIYTLIMEGRCAASLAPYTWLCQHVAVRLGSNLLLISFITMEQIPHVDCEYYSAHEM